MKRILLIATILFWLPFTILAQNNSTHFLGIPVDGPKSEMIEKIKDKGFTYYVAEDYFTGYYYGYPVYLFVQAERGVVNRIIVYDIPQRSEKDIKKRFNAICHGFEKNNRYASLNEKSVKIPKKENLHHEITVHKKKYIALYNQIRTTKEDSLAIQKALLEADTIIPINKKLQITSLSERRRRIHVKALRRVTALCDGEHKRVVWFTISEKFNKYAMILVYDNLNNFPGC